MRFSIPPWLPFFATCMTAVVIAVRAEVSRIPDADEATRHDAYESLAESEPSFRRHAASGFPADPWSQDDDFHNQEYRLLRGAAAEDGVSISSLLAAVDEGMRSRWALPDPKTPSMRPTVPPCRPRPVY